MAVGDPIPKFDLLGPFIELTRAPFNEIKETLEALRTNEQRLKDIAAVLRCEPDQIIPKLIKQIDEHNDLKEEIARLQKELGQL